MEYCGDSPLPIILALLLARIKSEGIKKKIQLILYAPNFISVIVISGMIIVFLSPIGPVNQFLELLQTLWQCLVHFGLYM